MVSCISESWLDCMKFLCLPFQIGVLNLPQFWKAFQKGLGTQLHHNSAFQPQTDSQAERTIQTLKDMLREFVLDFKGSWDDQLPLIEFVYNNI